MICGTCAYGFNSNNNNTHVFYIYIFSNDQIEKKKLIYYLR